MQRGNYRNIGNNFVSGGTFNNPANARQTRSNASTASVNNVTVPISQSEPPQAPISQPIPQLATPQPVVESASEVKMEEKTSYSEDELMKLKKINFKKKVSGKEKRLKQNKKLFKMLIPRNAIAALNELQGSISETTVLPIQGNKFEAEVILNNVCYKGVGSSKMQAKNAACEKALRDLVIYKFQQVKNREGSTEDISMEDDNDTTDVPMLQLASFALHKLFAEWESEGFEIPLPKVNPEPAANAPSTEAKVSPKPPKIRTELPPNNEKMHPVMLLSVMRPCTTYSDLGSQGITPNIIHTVGCTVDGQSFLGQGKSKKEARKRLATEILIKLFNWKGSCC